jgi:hypothetical protein
MRDSESTTISFGSQPFVDKRENGAAAYFARLASGSLD